MTRFSGKQAIRLLEDHFTAGLNDPVIVVVATNDLTTTEIQSGVAAAIERLETDPTTFFGPFDTVVSPNGAALLLRVPMSGVTAEAEVAVTQLREEILPSAFANTDAEVLVTGFAAGHKDFREFVYEKTP